MPIKPKRHLPTIRGSTKRKILLLLMTGLTLSLTRSPKQYFRIVKTAARGWRELKRHELYRAVKEFRHQLKELGLHEWQESVFVHPFPCENEINLLVEFLEIRSYVRSAEMSRPTNEAELK